MAAYGTRTTLAMGMEPVTDLDASIRPRIVANNTFEYQNSKGRVIRLHNTDIVQFLDGDRVQLFTDGWQTPTTKERMNQYIGPYQISQQGGIWYVWEGGEWHWAGNKNRGNRVTYFDGMILPDDFKPNNLDKKIKKQRKKIRDFVKLLDSMDELPMPDDSGECFLCQMVTQNPDMKLDCLESHIDEGYLRGCLIYNAMFWAGYRDPMFIMGLGLQMKTSIKSALRRYLYRKISVGAC